MPISGSVTFLEVILQSNQEAKLPQTRWSLWIALAHFDLAALCPRGSWQACPAHEVTRGDDSLRSHLKGKSPLLKIND